MSRHNARNQRYWDIITAEFPWDGPADEEAELFGIDEPLSHTIPEEFCQDEVWDA